MIGRSSIMYSSIDDWMDANYQRVVREEVGSVFGKCYRITYVPRSPNVAPYVSAKPALSVRRIVVAALTMSLLIVSGIMVVG